MMEEKSITANQGQSNQSLLSEIPKIYSDFWGEICELSLSTGCNREILHPLLEANLDKLDERIIELWQYGAANILPELEPGQAQRVAANIADLSNLISDYPLGNRASNLEIAIAGYKLAISVFTYDFYPEEWATLQNNLGATYTQRIYGERSNNLDSAITAIEAALKVRTQKSYPESRAFSQINLGTAYLYRTHGDKADNLEQAIAAFKAAIKEFNPETSPETWGKIQNNLAAAFSQRVQGDRADNLEQALLYSQNALQCFTKGEFPEFWANAQINLGVVYSDRIRGDKDENLEKAIAAYENALQIYTHKAFPEQWAEIQSHLAGVYPYRIHGDKAENLEEAIRSAKAALQVRTLETFPEKWAETQNSLAAAYSQRILGELKENFELAVAAYKAALKVYTPQAFPYDWAMIQNNLAGVYQKLGQNESAIMYLQSALRVFQPKILPYDSFRLGRNLGNTAFIAQLWTEAIEGYSVAIEAVESSREWASSDQRKQEILSDAIDVYTDIVQACINTEQSNRAIEYVERSKARNLVEILANRDLYPKGNIPETIVNKLKRLRREVVAEQRRLDVAQQNRSGGIIFGTGEPMLDSVAWLKNRDRLNQLLQQLDNLIATEIDPIDPNFRATQQVKPISYTEIQNLVDDRAAIVEWYITDDSFHTFIITYQSQHPQVWSSSAKERQAFLDWQEEYLQDYQQNREQWIEKLSECLNRLSHILHIDDIINSLPSNCDRLILIPHRFLHLIPLHALPLSEGGCLLDRFHKGVRYAPSCQLLQLTQNQERPNFDRLLAIQNPTKDLGYTTVEVGTIQRYFPHTDVFVENSAQKATLVEVKIKDNGTREVIQNSQLSLANCAHFSCHGEFNFESPLDSALLLADGERLTLGEIFDLDLAQCRLVTLSACETGLTNYKILSDEYVGIPSSFLYAGSPSVVSSLWTVQDVSTAFLMIKFYQNLPLSETVAIALNQAQLWLRDITKAELKAWITANSLPLDPTMQQNINKKLHKLQGDQKPFQSPFHWAAFCAIGQ